MSDDRIATAPGAGPARQLPVSSNNPCPFLRALVANGYVGGNVVPLPKLSETIALASGEMGSQQNKVRLETWLVPVGANGLGPLRVLKSATSGAVLDELRDGPLDKHGGGSRILDADAKVRSIDNDPDGRGLDDDIAPEANRINERAGRVSLQLERHQPARTRQPDGESERD